MTFPTLSGQNLKMLKRHFETTENISQNDIAQIVFDATEVFKRCLPPNSLGLTKGLIYGNIQSGKTAVILALIAIAADNGYSRFVVLTSDLNDLYEQTLERTKNTLHGLTVLGKTDLRNPINTQNSTPCVIVLSKNVRVLQRARTIVETPSWAHQNVLIIDDEADQASLDTAVNRPLVGPSGVHREISALREVCRSLAFVQTTATPQALLLQDANTAFRPDFVHVTSPGDTYCGGNVFFINENFVNPRYLRFVPLLDVIDMRRNQVLPSSMEDALLIFFVSAAVLRLQGSTKNYQALLHTSLRKNEHEFVTDLVGFFEQRVASAVSVLPALPGSHPDYEVIDSLSRAYTDICGTLPPEVSYSFEEVLQEIAFGIPSTAIIQINSTTGQGVQSNPNRRQIIYVGGAKLGRGVTIKNLLMTYYARDAQNPQIDTVLQHARMYGYRQRELACTRIFLPNHLAERFLNIHIADNSMRELVLETHEVIPVIPIPIRRLRATRRNVLSEISVELTTYIGGSQYYPLVPISSGQEVQDQTERLDQMLLDLCPDERRVYDVSLEVLKSLLDNNFSQVNAPGAWDDGLIRQAFGLLAADRRYGNMGQLIIGTRDSDVSKLATRSPTPQIQALLPATAGNPPYNSREDIPVLVFMRLNGGANRGWNGIPFWVPNLRFPNGNYAFSLNRT